MRESEDYISIGKSGQIGVSWKSLNNGDRKLQSFLNTAKSQLLVYSLLLLISQFTYLLHISTRFFCFRKHLVNGSALSRFI